MCEQKTCEVDECNGAYRVRYNKKLGKHLCHACRHSLQRNGTVDRKHRRKKNEQLAPVCENPNCDRTDSIMIHRETKLHLCWPCRLRYSRNGELGKPRKYIADCPPVCSVCRTRSPKYISCNGNERPRCWRCYIYFKSHGKERPLSLRTKECKNCRRPLSRPMGYCGLCRSYQKRHGKFPSSEYIDQRAPHGWCECGKPAEVQIDLRTGGLLVVPTKTGMTDYLTGTREEYAEWVCRECAGYEDEMQRHGGNTYEPSSYIKRE